MYSSVPTIKESLIASPSCLVDFGLGNFYDIFESNEVAVAKSIILIW